jgi:hypothetical protein
MTFEAWRQEYYAEFVNPSDLVYYKFVRERHPPKIPQVRELDIHWGWDFGAMSGCHSVLAHRHEGKIYAFDEICEGNTPANVDEFCRRYPPSSVTGIKLYGDYNGSYNTVGTTDYIMIVDMLNRRGYNIGPQDIRVYGGNPVVRARTENTNRLLEDGNREQHLFIATESCPKLVRDYELIKRKPDGGLDKGPTHDLTHTSDSLDYLLWVTDAPVMPDTRKPKHLLVSR